MAKQGVIVSSRRVGGGTEYIIFDGEEFHRRTYSSFVRGKGVKFDEKNISPSGSAWKTVHDRFISGLKADLDIPEDLAFLRGNFEVLWKELAFLKVVGAKPAVFFDGDADGIISALLLEEAVGPFKDFREARPVNHTTLAEGRFEPVNAPLVLLLDLGSDWNDAPGVCLLNHFAPTFVVDHHHVDRHHNCGVMINPALEKPELSRYNTAYLVSLLVQNWVKKEDWVRVAAAGDRSDVVDWSKEDRKRALALEMAFSIRSDLRLARRIIETDLWSAYYDLFEMIIERTLESAEMDEQEVNGKKVLVVWLDHTPRYPHKGKIASYLMDERGYDVVIVADKPFEPQHIVTMRGNANFLFIVRELGVKDYWGHPSAVTIRTADPKRDIEEILRHL